jgi:Leucine-rich repeat (LRR) protein
LVELPVDIGLLVCLEELRAANNRLSLLPVSISALTRLRRITFRGNPLQNIPPDFPERAQDVRQYLQSLQEDPVPNRTVKLVVVGQEGVGKTTLLKAIKRTSWILPQGFVETVVLAKFEVVFTREI